MVASPASPMYEREYSTDFPTIRFVVSDILSAAFMFSLA